MANHRLPLLRRTDHGEPAERVEPRAGADGDLAAEVVRAAGDEGADVDLLDASRDRHDLRQIGDLARETGKSVRAIHLYEELGLLTPAARSKGRFRLYGSESIVRIRWIARLQEMGFSLTDIQTVVREWQRVTSAPGAMKRMRHVFARKLEETREQKRRLEALEHELSASLEYLDTCDVCDPARLLSACECCDLHDKETHVPELVLGFRAH